MVPGRTELCLISITEIKKLWQPCTTPAVRKCVFWSLPLEVANVSAHLYCKICFKSLSICFRGTKYESFRERGNEEEINCVGVVSKTKTPKTKTRRPKTYENEDLRKRRPTKTKTPYENEDPPFFEAVGSTCSILNPSKVRSPSCTAYLWVPEYMT